MIKPRTKQLLNLSVFPSMPFGTCAFVIRIAVLMLVLRGVSPVAAQSESPDVCSVFSVADVQPIVGVFSPVC